VLEALQIEPAVAVQAVKEQVHMMLLLGILIVLLLEAEEQVVQLTNRMVALVEIHLHLV
jgi:hypothetical protein